MAEHLHTTHAFILGSAPYGEAHRLLDLFTEAHGRVRALARSVRREHSKLRFHLEPLSFATVSLVRGKELWRVTGAMKDEVTAPITKLQNGRFVAGNAVRLLRRLLQGEEANRELFFVLRDAVSFLGAPTHSLSSEDHHNLECVLVLRILHCLGYLGDDAPVAPYLTPSPLTTTLVRSIQPLRQDAIMKINASLHASSL